MGKLIRDVLESVDAYNWAALGNHIYASASLIPEHFHKLLSEDRLNQRDARRYLCGEGQDWGSITRATPWLVALIATMLPDQDLPSRGTLFEWLSAVAGTSVKNSFYSRQNWLSQALTYEQLSKYISTYLDFLSDSNARMRLTAARLLGFMATESAQLLPILVKSYENEPEDKTRIQIVEAVGNLLGNDDLAAYQSNEEFRVFLETATVNESSADVRFALALAAFEAVPTTFKRTTRVKPFFLQIMVETFPLKARVPWEQERIVHLLATQGADTILPLLQLPDIDIKTAHLLVQGLVFGIFRTGLEKVVWRENGIGSKQPEHYRFFAPNPQHSLLYTKENIGILTHITEFDPFWERPLNLLSFFAGLPDSREELRALVRERSQQLS